jgi:hypothetical protein
MPNRPSPAPKAALAYLSRYTSVAPASCAVEVRRVLLEAEEIYSQWPQRPNDPHYIAEGIISMAHLVSMPPPPNYQLPQMTTFKADSSGRNDKIFVWRAPPAGTWRVGTDIASEVTSFPMDWMFPEYPDLTYAELQGVRPGMRLAVFISRPMPVQWQRVSDYVDVVPDKASTQSKHKRISYYPLSDQPTISSEKFEKALELLSSNPIGRAVLDALRDDVIVRFEDSSGSAERTTSGEIRIWINVQSDGFRPGTGVDELLLHELIHVVENWYKRYENRYNFQWDETDFLTVNATNVYSCMRGRALRKDHGNLPLPIPHFRDPKLHWTEQEPNYVKAGKNIPNLVRTMSQIKNIWNPFIYWS